MCRVRSSSSRVVTLTGLRPARSLLSSLRRDSTHIESAASARATRSAVRSGTLQISHQVRTSAEIASDLSDR